MIEKYADLVNMAKEQKEGQRLLFLFAKTNTTRGSRKRDDKKGTLDPVMCVDKLPEEVPTFAGLVEEADTISKDWDLVLIAALSGEPGKAPTTEEAEPFLNQMTNDLANGQNIARYVIFDREENPIMMQAV